MENKEIIDKTIHYIEEMLKESGTSSLKLDEISKAVGYSKYHLNRMFTKATGQTIHKYIKQRRLIESAKNLIMTDREIADIAQDSGYTTQQSYTLAFRGYYNCTPKVYRRLYQIHMFNKKDRAYSRMLYRRNSCLSLHCRGVIAA